MTAQLLQTLNYLWQNQPWLILLALMVVLVVCVVLLRQSRHKDFLERKAVETLKLQLDELSYKLRVLKQKHQFVSDFGGTDFAGETHEDIEQVKNSLTQDQKTRSLLERKIDELTQSLKTLTPETHMSFQKECERVSASIIHMSAKGYEAEKRLKDIASLSSQLEQRLSYQSDYLMALMAQLKTNKCKPSPLFLSVWRSFRQTLDLLQAKDPLQSATHLPAYMSEFQQLKEAPELSIEGYIPPVAPPPAAPAPKVVPTKEPAPEQVKPQIPLASQEPHTTEAQPQEAAQADTEPVPTMSDTSSKPNTDFIELETPEAAAPLTESPSSEKSPSIEEDEIALPLSFQDKAAPPEPIATPSEKPSQPRSLPHIEPVSAPTFSAEAISTKFTEALPQVEAQPEEPVREIIIREPLSKVQERSELEQEIAAVFYEFQTTGQQELLLIHQKYAALKHVFQSTVLKEPYEQLLYAREIFESGILLWEEIVRLLRHKDLEKIWVLLERLKGKIKDIQIVELKVSRSFDQWMNAYQNCQNTWKRLMVSATPVLKESQGKKSLILRKLRHDLKNMYSMLSQGAELHPTSFKRKAQNVQDLLNEYAENSFVKTSD